MEVICKSCHSKEHNHILNIKRINKNKYFVKKMEKEVKKNV